MARYDQKRNDLIPYRKGRKKRNRIVPLCIGILSAVIILTIGMILVSFLEKNSLHSQGDRQNITGLKNESFGSEGNIEGADIKINLENLNSPNAILIDADSGEVLAEHNSKEQIYPASMTKIMTAILTIENCKDLSGTVTFTNELLTPLFTEGASMAGFQPGEQAELKDVLYGVILPSGAECCEACAEAVAGSEERFVEMMNEKAKELGMNDTHFCNVTGLHDPKHISTVKDFSVLLKYAVENEVFREIFTSSRHSMPPTDQHPDGFTVQSTMFQEIPDPDVTGGKILGGKTGYTEEAGLCLASMAEINGKEYILVTAHARGNHFTEQFHISDAVNVYNQIGEICASRSS